MKDKLLEVLDKLREGVYSEAEALEEIDSCDEVREVFIDTFLDIVKDELSYGKLTDFVDSRGMFGYKDYLENLLRRCLDSLRWCEYGKDKV